MKITSGTNAGLLVQLLKAKIHTFPFVIGRFLLSVLHLLYSLYLFVVDCWPKVAEVNEIKDVLHTFKKIPSHLAFILGEEEPSYEDLSNVVAWSCSAGIKHVTFYDYNNGIDPEVLFNHICKSKKQYIPSIKWGTSFDEEIKNQSKKSINGFKWNPVVTVHIHKKENGLENIVECVKEFYRSGLKEIDQEGLNLRLQKTFAAPDPDVAVICGETLSYYGFPPWHLKITQMLPLKSHHNMSSTVFLKILNDFCNCEQRYGK